MPRYSKTSANKLAQSHEDLQVLFKYVVENYDNTIVTGHRGEEEQEKAYRDGNSKLHYPFSKHNQNPSLAVDSAPYEQTKIDWSKLQCAHYAGYVMGVADTLFRIGVMKHRIRSGADWDNDKDVNDTTFWDACHFEIIPNEDEK